MSAHTPGPWAVRIGEQSVGTGRLVEVVAANGEVICCNERYHPTAIYERDAPLIAAAPELLAALKAAMAFIESHIADPDLTHEMASRYAELVAAKPEVAIAKAEGRE